MKKLLFIIALVSSFVQGQEISIPPSGGNQKAEVSQWMGLVKVTISYSSPNIHGPKHDVDRKGHIWGDLVPYGLTDEGYGPSLSVPWRAGANMNTTISFSHDVKVEGKDIKAGTYGLFLIVEKDGPWTWIFSKNANSWGSFSYDPAEDALRVNVQAENAPYTEYLTYGFDNRLIDSTVAYLQWENKRVPLSIMVPDYKELYVAKMREELRGWAGFSYQNWAGAAQWCALNKVNLEQALVWADKAINVPFRGLSPGTENFATLQVKSAVLRALKRNDEADIVMDKAIHHFSATVNGIYNYGLRLVKSGRQDKALEVFKYNQQRYPEEKFWTYRGLGQGYAAAGDKKKAIANLEIALKNVPESMRSSVTELNEELSGLKSGK